MDEDIIWNLFNYRREGRCGPSLVSTLNYSFMNSLPAYVVASSTIDGFKN